MSPSLPYTGMVVTWQSRYAVVSHGSSDRSPRSAMIVGAAVATMAASSPDRVVPSRIPKNTSATLRLDIGGRVATVAASGVGSGSLPSVTTGRAGPPSGQPWPPGERHRPR